VVVLEVEVQMKYKRLVHNLRELDQPGHRSIYIQPCKWCNTIIYQTIYLFSNLKCSSVRNSNRSTMKQITPQVGQISTMNSIMFHGILGAKQNELTRRWFSLFWGSQGSCEGISSTPLFPCTLSDFGHLHLTLSWHFPSAFLHQPSILLELYQNDIK
jgi:hypothetical protein